MFSQHQRHQFPAAARFVVDTPLGPLRLFFSAKGLAGVAFGPEEEADTGVQGAASAAPEDILPTWREHAAQALQDYFAGKADAFASLLLDPQGTPFQMRVWRELQKIPWGTTISYKELAARAGSAQGFRAVGQANGCNPLPIIIPCHRVIAADGSLGGYSSGLERKRWLLRHEGVY
jgi:methylated-DNA-[protein]-cysteine S-methyltransferase